MQEPPSTQAGRSQSRGAAGSHPELGGGRGGDPGLELAASCPPFGGAMHLGGLTQMCMRVRGKAVACWAWGSRIWWPGEPCRADGRPTGLLTFRLSHSSRRPYLVHLRVRELGTHPFGASS